MISIVISTYNQPRHLEKIFESIEVQPFRDYELLVVDDGSKNRKENQDIAESNGAKYFWHKDEGFYVSKTRNKGARESSGEYLHFLDGDTIVGKYTYEPYINALEKGTLLVGLRYDINNHILNTPVTQITIDNLVLQKDFRIEHSGAPLSFSAGNFMAPREEYLDILWDENFKWFGYDDWDFYGRWSLKYPTKIVPESITYHIDHPSKMGDPRALKYFLSQQEKRQSSLTT